MLELPENCVLFDCVKNRNIEATLVRLDRHLAKTKIDGTWWNIPVSKATRMNEEDHHWEWRKLVGLHHKSLAWEAIAVCSDSGEVEGAILYRIDAKSRIDDEKGAIYVDRIATAPRNRPWLVSPEYKGIGSTLLLTAVRQSYYLGFGGRVWLESLPSVQTRNYYSKRVCQVISEREDGISLELTVANAEKWLESEGYL